MIELPAVRALIAEQNSRGLQTGVQLSVSHRGQIADLAIGTNGADDELTTTTQVPWTCSSKPIGAVAFGALWDAGLVDLSTPVGDVLPEFRGGGHDEIRMRDLLAHTTGIAEPLMSADITAIDITSWDDIDAFIWQTFCAARCDRRPGSKMDYGAISHWFVLDRVLNALSGSASGDSYRTMMDRLGLSATLGPDWARPESERVTVGSGEAASAGLERMQLASSLPLPGVGVWGPVGDLRVIGQMLLADGVHRGERIISTQCASALTATHWGLASANQISDTLFPYGLGFMTGTALFGKPSSPRTYGHAGGNTSTLLVDPLYDLVVAVYWNGRLDDPGTFARRFALVRALHEDLGLQRTADEAAPATTSVPT